MYPRLSTYADEREARANLARMEAEADAAELARREVVSRIKRNCWRLYEGWRWEPASRSYTVRCTGLDITIDRDGKYDQQRLTEFLNAQGEGK